MNQLISMKKLPDKPNKILVIKYRFVGDTVLTVPFLRNLKYQYPEVKIDMLVEAVSGEFLKHCPYIDHLIIYENKPTYDSEKLIIPPDKSFIGLTKFIKAQKYNMSFLLKRSFSSALMTFLAGIPLRIGFDTDARRYLLTHKVSYDTIKHEADCFLDLLRQVNIPVKDTFLEAWSGPSEQEYIKNLLAGKTSSCAKKVLINAGTSNPNKKWSESAFALVIEELINNFDSQIFFLGIEKEKELYNQILSKISKPLKYPVINMLGETNIVESVELLKRMDLIIGVDSGMLHLAASVGIPAISIFGPMNDTKWAPLSDNSTILTADVPCRPCNLHKDCTQGLICMNTISHRQVIAAAAKYFKEK